MESDISIIHLDDDPGIGDLTATYLEREDERFSVRSTTDISEVFDLLSDEVDCLISDYDMPMMNGIEVLKEVREEYPNLPFILYTGKGSEEIASEAVSAGVTDYLQKESNVEQYAVLANRIASAVEQRRVEQRVEQERERFEVLFERLAEPVVEAEYENGEPIVRRVNSAFEDVFGYAADEIEDCSLDEYIIPDGEQPEASKINQQFQAGSHSLTREVTRKCVDGNRDFLLQTAGFDKNNRGFAIYTDITSRKQREHKRQALHRVADDLATSTSVKDVCERTVAASEEILAFDMSVISIQDDDRLIPTAASENVNPDHITTMSTSEGVLGKTLREQEPYRFEDASTHPEANPQGPYQSAISIPIGTHGVFQAVSRDPATFDEQDLELAELLISHSKSALDRITHEQQVRQQTDQIEQLVSVVSHDIRSPLSVAQGHLEMLRDEYESPHIDDIEQAHQRITELVDTVLTLRESTNNELNEAVSLERLAKRSWETVETPEAKLVTDGDDVLTGDPSRLQQLFENLYRNTIDHSSGQVTVTVGELADGFYVEDTGPGIPENEREKIFTPGYSTDADNTGLGLAIVQNVAQTHGFEVVVTQANSGGVRFEFKNT